MTKKRTTRERRGAYGLFKEVCTYRYDKKKEHHVTRERRGAYGLFKEVCTYIGGSQFKKKLMLQKMYGLYHFKLHNQF
jgi:hypothetical protein